MAIPVDFGRDIIFVADVSLGVDDVAAAGAEATRIIESLGGFVFGQQTSGTPEPHTVLVFKVAPGDFQTALARLGEIGDIRNQSITADDVTERVVDLESRISTAQASAERLRGFLENATDVKTISDLERELLERETQLETLRGQLRTIRDRVDLATITVTLTQALSRPEMNVVMSAYPGHDGGTACGGESALTVDEGGAVTVCFEITNTGDAPLTNFDLREPVLDLELADLTVVFGDLETVMEPGESLVLAADVVLERSVRPQARVTAVPVNDDGEPLLGRAPSQVVTMSLQAVDPGGVPGFNDGFFGAVDILMGAARIGIFAFGALVPFLPVLAAVWLILRWLARRQEEPVIAKDGEVPAH